MPGGSNANRDSGHGGNYGSKGSSGSSKSGSSSLEGTSRHDKGHYYGDTVRTVKQAAIRYADAKEQVNKTEVGTKEREDALKELGDAGINLGLVE